MKKHKKIYLQEAEKLNLIPILDAVFILIFFLLLSTNFSDLFQIETRTPTQNFVEETKIEESKQVFVSYSESEVVFSQGKKTNILQKFDLQKEDFQWTDINRFIKKIKEENPQEDQIIISADKNLPYKSIVYLIDQLTLDEKSKEIFSKILFEKNE